ncbi:hypothetical protein, partial [Cupriavidus sp. CuC1]|uniref:hypothetical protein n=1 Tax=Cupriavidus sp. CuC1 TaxID=3373131 RepID=UPI0037D53F69
AERTVDHVEPAVDLHRYRPNAAVADPLRSVTTTVNGHSCGRSFQTTIVDCRYLQAATGKHHFH